MVDSILSGSDADRAAQQTPARYRDRARPGLDLAALRPPDERARPALDRAEITDRIDQAWILPADDYDHRSSA